VGVPVAKHGNRSITSVCGSADLLELLGVKIDLSVDRIEEEMAALGFGFFFAPLHHPATKVAGPARKRIQGKTLFNLLGPLSNPASADYQLLGVYDKKILYPMAESLHELGVLKALVVHGEDGMDEITLCGKTFGAWLEPNGGIRDIEITPESVGLARVSVEKLRCATKESSKEEALKVLKGEKGPKTDFVLINAGAALWLVGLAKSHAEGVNMAREAIVSGKAMRHLKAIVDFSQKPEKK
jgi:anthranilate phosphoribosyltransferase